MTPANKDEDDGHNILVPIKEEPIDDDDNHPLVATPDQPADKPCIPTSNTKSEQESSPVSQLTHMDTEDYTFDNIEPLPYNDDEQIALHGCLGNHFVDLMNSPTHPPSIGTEKAFAFEDLPDLPDIEAISAASPHLFPFYPPHWPSYQGLPHTYHASRNFGYSQTDDHSTNSNSTSSLRPKLSNNPSTAPYGRRFANPLRNTAEEQEIIPVPTDNDVLCGRGGAINNHPGNKRFRHFINDLKYQYLNESKQTKPKVAMRVLQLVSQSNPPGRFLMKFPEGYLECSEERAKEKGEPFQKLLCMLITYVIPILTIFS